MRSQYNIQQIPRPAKASVLIKRRLTEIAWQHHPTFKERQKIFIGRHDILKLFEERFNDLEKDIPTCIIASGIPEMGRKTVLTRCCIQNNIFDEKHLPVSIALNYQQSIEDFIRELYDLGFSSDRTFKALIEKSVEEKVDIAKSLIQEIQRQDEIILIIDDDCIVSKDGEISAWFLSLFRTVAQGKVTFLVASRYQFYRSRQKLYEEDRIYELAVPELSPKERESLLKRYAQFKGLSLSTKNYQDFSSLLTGFPPQVFRVVDLIEREGILNARKIREEVRDYSRVRAKALLENLTSKELDFLRLIGEFDSVSYDLLFKIVEEKELSTTIERFLGSAICEQMGNSGEYIRVNDAVRDYISRIKYSLDIQYERKLRSLLADFLATYQSEEKDSSDYFYFLKKALKEGQEVSLSDLIPSHFLKAMRDLYDHENNHYQEVVDLANRALRNEIALDKKVKDEIRSLLLRSMARLAQTEATHRNEFLTEMKRVQGEVDAIGDYTHKRNAQFQQHFLYGFFYRLQGRPAEALERLDQALNIRQTSNPARREKVNVLMDIGAYEDALLLAKSNYEDQPTNLYHAEAYFRCLINGSPANETHYGVEPI
jgi:hypothetical protein